MAKGLRCKDLGLDCDSEIHGDSEQEVLDKLFRHIQTAHHMEAIPPESALRVRSLISDEQAVKSSLVEEVGMVAATSNNRLDLTRLIIIPSVITLFVTLFRLTGELRHWSTVLFNPAAGGGGALIGISLLVPIFGIYFALKLSAAGTGPGS